MEPVSPSTQSLFIARAIIEFSNLGNEMTDAIDTVVEDHYLSMNTPIGVLTRLRVDGPKRPNELADEVDMTTGGMTKVIDRLEGFGLVARTGGLEDGRGVMVSLTEHGIRTIDDVFEVMIGPVERLIKALAALQVETALND